MNTKVRRIAVAFALGFLFASSAVAGPPLVCHVFDIGNAKSLPWISHGWSLTGNEPYNTSNLAADTIAILDNDATVLVHMETLRRALVYSEKDPDAGKQLLLRLIARSDAAAKDTPASALATFDLGYLAAAFKEYHWIYKDSVNPAQGLDGYALVKKALQRRSDDSQMQFAAALVTLDGPAFDHQEYTQNAFAGAKTDALLARNLYSHFISPQSETMAELLTRNTSIKVARQ